MCNFWLKKIQFHCRVAFEVRNCSRLLNLGSCLILPVLLATIRWDVSIWSVCCCITQGPDSFASFEVLCLLASLQGKFDRNNGPERSMYCNLRKHTLIDKTQYRIQKMSLLIWQPRTERIKKTYGNRHDARKLSNLSMGQHIRIFSKMWRKLRPHKTIQTQHIKDTICHYAKQKEVLPKETLKWSIQINYCMQKIRKLYSTLGQVLRKNEIKCSR